MTTLRSPLREALAGAKRRAINSAMRMLPEEQSLKLQYLRGHHRWPDLEHPARYTEKLQWLKLHAGYERHSGWIDKIEAKKRVAAILGEQWITPTLWSGDTLPPREERNWPTPYVIKANHGSGWLKHVVTDEDRDWPAIERACARWLRQRWHPHLHEVQYARIAPQLLVEPRLNGAEKALPFDYKIHVFGGRAEHVAVIVGREETAALAVMDREWRRLPFAQSNMPLAPATPERPRHLDAMIAAAERLAAPFPYARVDFYELPDGPRFGEITLLPSSGFLPITPDEWDERIGAMLELPQKTPAKKPWTARRALADVKRRTINAAFRCLPAELSLKLQYLRAHHRWPDLARPTRFSEKMQVLKLRGGLEAHADWVDKVRAKERVGAILGPEWITPTLWRGTQLPPREERTWPTPYVIKANHGSGWCVHVASEADKDWPRIERRVARWLRKRWHPHLHERQYAAIAPQLLVEPRLGDGAALPCDYKFHVLNGRARFVHVCVERLQGVKLATFDRDWKPLPHTQHHLPRPDVDPPKPAHYDAMLKAAERLAAPFTMARVDFYDLPDGPRFGEITLVPASGLLRITPDPWDETLGAMLDVSQLLAQDAEVSLPVSAPALQAP